MEILNIFYFHNKMFGFTLCLAIILGNCCFSCKYCYYNDFNHFEKLFNGYFEKILEID